MYQVIRIAGRERADLPAAGSPRPWDFTYIRGPRCTTHTHTYTLTRSNTNTNTHARICCMRDIFVVGCAVIVCSHARVD